jgi:hypothetical protein
MTGNPPISKLVKELTTEPCTAPLPETFPVTLWSPVNVFAPSVAKGGVQTKGSALNALPDGHVFEAILSVPLDVIGFGEAVSPVPALTLVTVPLPLPPL